MKHDNLLAGWRKLVVAAGLATLGSVLVITTSFAQPSANCRAYAEDYSSNGVIRLGARRQIQCGFLSLGGFAFSMAETTIVTRD
jgi:hypothetical protein